MRSSELDYELPPELIAQRPLERGDDSRLLVFERASGAVRHRGFRELREELPAGALVVVNDTRVLPARLRLSRPGGGGAAGRLRGRRAGGGGGWGPRGGGGRPWGEPPPPAVPPGAAHGSRALPDGLRARGRLRRCAD